MRIRMRVCLFVPSFVCPICEMVVYSQFWIESFALLICHNYFASNLAYSSKSEPCFVSCRLSQLSRFNYPSLRVMILSIDDKLFINDRLVWDWPTQCSLSISRLPFPDSGPLPDRGICDICATDIIDWRYSATFVRIITNWCPFRSLASHAFLCLLNSSARWFDDKLCWDVFMTNVSKQIQC